MDELGETRTCCAPARPGPPAAIAQDALSAPGSVPATLLRLGGGEFLMGTEDSDGFPEDGEGPIRAVRLSPFWIDAVAVSNRASASSPMRLAIARTPSARVGRSC
jgi:sulfatase modifying factor 1